jgi:VCBS repeat-containing protein
MRDDRHWNFRSLLLVASMPSWLVGDAKAKSPAPKKQAGTPARPQNLAGRQGLPGNETGILAAGAMSNPRSHERLVEDLSSEPAGSGEPSIPSAVARPDAAVGKMASNTWTSATMLPFGDNVGSLTAGAFETAVASLTAGEAGQSTGVDGTNGPSSGPAAASGQASAAAQATGSAVSSSGPVLTLGTVPTGPSVADIIGYMPSPTDPVGQSDILLCCGGCGYINCPTRLLEQAGAQLNGQRPGSGLADGRDYVSSGQSRFGASKSAVMSLDQVTPFANWRENAKPVVTNVNQVPGGGETATGRKFIGTPALSGRLKTVTMPQARAKAASQLAAATDTNPIVLENQKPGNPESEWGIVGAGDSNIEGFATDISVNRGSTANFKINTNSNNYRIDIYRMGYYGGMGARKVATIQRTGLQNQPAPLRDAATGAVDAGNWAVSASWAVPADAVSGVYIAKLVRQDGTPGQNHIPFIVRDDSSQSDIIFQTADTTWQAYNGWGGANLYGGNGPATGQGGGRAFAVSYNRPIATRGGVGTFAGPQDYLFGAEYAAISWLEENGYDVSYMAGVDADRHGSLLLNHKLYLDVGHDEYWSGQQRTNVEAARDAGVNLAFWSGNEVYWRTRWGTAFSADGTPYRTLICYKETWANSSIDPSSEWTGTFRDPRFSPPAVGGGSPENALTGTIFQVDDVGNNLQAITIPHDDANLRFWRNTSVANLQPGQTATLTKNYLGYEWDEASDNGFDPAGLIRLSSTTLPVSTYLLDYGNTTGPGTSTHNLTLYRAPSGALVFGAGTVYWAWGLSDNHDLQVTPTDARVQQAMINLFADMGIQPATLQPGLIAGVASTDNTRPTSTINALGTIALGSTVTISGTATDAGGGVIAGVEVSTDNGASWHPATGDETWTYSWRPQVAGSYTIRSRAADDSVNLETPLAGRTVTVAGPTYTTLFAPTATPAVVNTTDASAVELGVRFQSSVAGNIHGIRYYKGSQDTGTHTGALWSSTGTRLASLTFTNETTSGWQMATFSSPVAISPGVTYTASYHTNVGHYSNTANYFTSDVTSGPLTAPAAGNGVFTYGSTSQFPTSTFQSTNFWVDVLFAPAASGTGPTAVADTGDATEKGGVANGSGGSLATGNVLTNDTDPDPGDTKTVTAIRFGTTNGTLGTALAGTYGGLVLNANGSFTYTINENNAAVQALRLTTNTLSEVYSYTMRDSAGATSTATLTVRIHGANDAPVLAQQTPSQNAIIGSAFSLTLPAGTFTDVDTGDTLTYAATSATGTALPSWLTFNSATRTFSGTPTSANSGTLAVRVTATDAGGLAASETFNIVVSATPTPAAVSLFSASSTPAQANLNDGSQIELGVKFQSSVAGQVTGIKFYRSAGDTGQNIVNLWASTGTNLGTATFTNTAASGWQTVTFSAPVSIAANTTYVASYHTTGAYVATSNFFSSPVTSGVLTAPSSSSSGGNGVYRYGGTASTGIFPNSSWNASNYFADVVFVASAGSGNTPPTAVADTGDATEKGGVANASGGSLATGNVLTNDTDPNAGDTKTVTAIRFGATNGTLGAGLAGAYGSLVLNANGTYTYTINETNSAVQALRQSTNTLSEVYSYTMRDTAGATSTANLTITVHGANDAPVLAAQTANQNAVVGSAFSLTLPAGTFTDVDTGDTLTYTATQSNGSALPAWLTFNGTTRTFSGTPAAGNVGTVAVRVAATDLGGLAASETFNIAVSTTPTTPTTVSVFSASATPAQTNLNDGQQLELGMKFTSSAAGQVTALKFYRSPGDTGQNVLGLWTSTGTRLASATFTNTAASGWQTVPLTTPVNIAANTTYVTSYHTTGAYVATSNFFTNAVASGVLTAPSSSSSGGNGVYRYGGTASTGIFPNSSWNASNYYADVVFQPQLAT